MKKKTIENLKYWLNRKWIDIRYPFRQIAAGIRNLWRWLPIVWKDRDWDDAFIFYVLKFKLQNTADYLERTNRFVGSEHEVSRIRLCIKLIERVQEDHYGMEFMDYETTEFRFVPTTTVDENGDNYYEMKSEMIEDRLDDYFNKYPLVYKQVVAKLDEPSRSRIALHMGYHQHAKAKRLLFNVLNNHIESWWD